MDSGMEKKTREWPPGRFPFQLPEEYGTCVAAAEEADGVYYISMRQGEEKPYRRREYYVVCEATSVISQEAKAHGKELRSSVPLRLYDLENPESGYMIISFELSRHRKLHGQREEELLYLARSAMEHHPDYFGRIPAPTLTPWGQMLRYRELALGIFEIETEQLKRCIAISYTIWDTLCSDEARSLAWSVSATIPLGSTSEMGYAFYQIEDSCMPLYEIWPYAKDLRKKSEYEKIKEELVKRFPDYPVE